MTCGIVVLLIVALSRLHSCYCQSFSLHPKSSFELKGSDVTLTCQATGLVSPSYYWLKDGVNVTRGTYGVTNLKAFLTIKSLTFGDTGSYVCRATGNANTITSNNAQLVIQGSPDIVNPPSPLTSHEGFTVQFTCGAVANPQLSITWYHNSRKLTNGGRFTIFGNGSLVISTLTKADAGTYRCTAKNSLGEDSAFADLTVLDPPSAPKFTTTPSNASATEGTMVVFYCQASGSPSPTISWKRINGTIPSDRRSQPRPGALGISNLQPLDDGRYACVAKNSQGESVAYVHLSIKGYPRFIVTPSSKVVKEKDSVSFTCAANSDPKPRVTWQLPNGTVVSKETASSGNIHVLQNNTLNIEIVQEDNQGIYACIASNSVGTRKVKATLSVQTVPRFTTSLQNVTKTRGQDLAITCPARANPSPSFQWLYKGSIIGRTQELRLTSVNVSFEGTYTCRVNNTMGTASEEFFLRIIVAPVITLKPSNQTIGIGGTARFSCQSSGDPTPSITWYKGGVRVQEGARYSILTNSTLVIVNTVDSDKGWFTCRATNTAGRSEGKVYLFITDSPSFTSLPSNTTVGISKMARLTCRAAAKETPRITWFKTDQSGSLVGKVDSANVLVSGDLRINSAKRSDRSYYVCRACNAAGCVTTLPVMLNVLYYPSFLDPPKDVGVLQGQDATLKCEPDASPKAVITWRRPNGEVFGGKEYQQIIHDVQPSKTGDYKCEASNYLGDAGPVTIRLTIQTKSVITDITRKMSSVTETITCLVSGTPLPLVAWYVGKDLLPRNAQYPNYIVTADKKLQIPAGSLEKENFMCKATNPQNTDAYLVKAPVAPTSVSATDVTSNSLKVTWVRPSPQYLVTHYRLEKWSAESSWELVDDTIKEQLYSVFRLSAFTIYQFRLKGVNGLGTSNYSMTSGNVSTLSSSPSTPRDVAAHVISASQINVTWSIPSNLNGRLNDLMYRLMYYPKLPNITNDFNISHDKAKNVQEYTISDLDADIQYLIKVFAWRHRSEDSVILMSDGVSSSARTLQIVPLTPPLGLVVVSNGPHQIIAKWQKPPYSVRGYNVLFMETGGNFTTVNIANGAAISHVIMDLKESTVYMVKVQMYSNVDDQGPFSRVFKVKTATDEFGSIAGQSQDEKTINWKVAVGGLVCGIVLIVLVLVTVWWWWKRTRQTNNTFTISKRRRRTPSSVASEGSIEGQYNIGAFNPELDTDLDLEMFAHRGNVVPISTSFSNERAIAYLDPTIGNESNDFNQQTNSIYENDVTQGKAASNRNGARPNLYDNVEVPHKEPPKPTYAQVDMSKKKKRSNDPSVEVPKLQPSNQVPTYAQVDMSKKKNRSNGPSVEVPKLQPSNQVPTYAQVDVSEYSSPVDEVPQSNEVPVKESSSTPADINTRFSNTSDDIPDFHYPDDDSDLSDVPFPDEDMPRLERTWTNVSEFNFPPPPIDPPPGEPTTVYQDDTPDIVPIHQDPSNDVPSNEYPKDNGPSNKSPKDNGSSNDSPKDNGPSNKSPKDNGPSNEDNGIKKRRMVASWAEVDNEPMGNLWEAVDKELDRRLGTT